MAFAVQCYAIDYQILNIRKPPKTGISRSDKKGKHFCLPPLCHLLIGKMYSLDKLPTNGRSSTWMSAPCKRPTLRFG